MFRRYDDLIPGYSNGKVFFQDYCAGSEGWVWYVRREIVSSRAVQLCRADDAAQLEALRKQGVEVPRDSTADAILRSLVRKGYAVRVPD
jgi:hypothetical protein